jgi:hypothetical protein
MKPNVRPGGEFVGPIIRSPRWTSRRITEERAIVQAGA